MTHMTSSEAPVPAGGGRDARWNLTRSAPVPLTLRLCAAALGTGSLAGWTTAVLLVPTASSATPLAARVLGIALVPVAVALIAGLRVAATTGRLRSGPARRLPAAVVVVTALLTPVPQLAASVGTLGNRLEETAGYVVLAGSLGAVVGLAAALAVAVVLAPVLLALRAAKARLTLHGAQVTLTLGAVAVIGVLAVPLFVGLDAFGASEANDELGLWGIALSAAVVVALAGVCAGFTARWVLVDRRA